MTYRFEKVIDGLSKYIDREIYGKMTDMQEIVARVFVGRIINNTEGVKKALIENGYIRTFGIIGEDGMVDIDTLAKDVKREIERKGKLVVSIPMFGKMTFTPEDVDVILNYIKGEM
jgi:hypothetical protein